MEIENTKTLKERNDILLSIDIEQLIKRVKEIEFDGFKNHYIFRDIKGNEILVDKKTYLNLCEYFERR